MTFKTTTFKTMTFKTMTFKTTTFNKLVLATISTGLLFLGACRPSAEIVTETSTPEAPKTASEPIASAPAKASDHAGVPQVGGQVVESGPYHLEFVSETAAEGAHLDLYLQKGDTHEAIPDAKVSAQIQLPDGTPQSLELKYDAEGKHYTALLPVSLSGEYQVAILSDISGEKVNARFSFKQ